MAAISLRINTLLLVLLVLMAAAIIAMLATRAYGGPLDPTGPPAATDGVREAGTPISSLPFVITTPGYYYVTRPLTGTLGSDGITVSTSNVTIDLGSFTLTGSPNTSYYGVIVGAFRNVVIQNGSIRGWGAGILAGGCSYCRISRVQVVSNSFGISIGAQSEISDCNVSLNGIGIQTNSSVVRNCTLAENGIAGIDLSGDSSLVEGNRVNVNGDGGDPSQTGGIKIAGNRNTVRDNQLSGNLGTDLMIDAGSTYNVITGNVYCTAIDGGTITTGIGNNC